MPGKELPALRLEEAKKGLEAQLTEALRGQAASTGALAFDLNLEEDPRRADADRSEDEIALRNAVRSIVETFHRSDIVAETGVRVYKVTAIDSNGDGVPALSVKYEYGVDTGMAPERLDPLTRTHLPPSSAA